MHARARAARGDGTLVKAMPFALSRVPKIIDGTLKVLFRNSTGQENIHTSALLRLSINSLFLLKGWHLHSVSQSKCCQLSH